MSKLLAALRHELTARAAAVGMPGRRPAVEAIDSDHCRVILPGPPAGPRPPAVTGIMIGRRRPSLRHSCRGRHESPRPQVTAEHPDWLGRVQLVTGTVTIGRGRQWPPPSSQWRELGGGPGAGHGQARAPPAPRLHNLKLQRRSRQQGPGPCPVTASLSAALHCMPWCHDSDGTKRLPGTVTLSCQHWQTVGHAMISKTSSELESPYSATNSPAEA